MQSIRKFVTSLKFRLIVGTALLLLILNCAEGAIGYYLFTDFFVKEYNESAFRTAETAAAIVDADRIEEYLATGGGSDDYRDRLSRMNTLCQKQGATLIYVVKVDTSDYGSFETVFSVGNENRDVDVWEIGYRWSTTNEEYRELYRQIYEEGLQQGTVTRTRNLRGREPHTTAVIPLTGSDGQVKGILCVERPMEILDEGRQTYLRNISTVTVLMLLVAVLGGASYLNRQIVKPLEKVNREAKRFATENSASAHTPLKNISQIREIRELGNAIEKMEHDTLEYMDHLTSVTAEKERIGTELNLATRIQSDMLPNIFPPFPEREDFDVFATMTPAREVGGDFYDFFMVDDSHLAFVVADVSGKGVPAALFMVTGKTLIKDHTGLHEDLGEVFTEVNRILCASNSEEMFITAFEGVLDLKTGELRYVNAGHETPFICRKNGVYEPFKVRPGFVLAGMDGIRYKSGSVQLAPGDRIFQYSDGIPEAINGRGEPYGMERLGQVLAGNSGKTPAGLLPAVKADVDAFVGGAEQFDDITMLCVEFKGTEPGKAADISAPPDQDSIKTVAAFIESTLEAWDIPMKAANRVQIAVDEIYSNIVYYSQAQNARLNVSKKGGVLMLLFEDDGKPYDPTTAKQPEVTLPVEERSIGGLGIFMVRKMATDIHYKHADGKNMLTVKFCIE